ncbi:MULTISPECIES: alpha/beta hydrolase [unclassified Acinetobacter]|uniref:alpha/beta hydrolase n=1 Tax=unclassified Acinetobacter TaxID=196816 RepID=UPI002934121D|nr:MULTISPECIES: alpha/beta hydrolase [unclassified Acinetobacter]WOE31618.1 alpha/beta hydrolase [Acinetobacter sp. SAAs470]WOE37083.1 alpha/beta hydrolase [Acinetobacter sp. SAAs474]
MTHTVIVPGVGGSEYHHWQSWLQRQLMSCSRIEQKNWQQPILNEWVAECAKTLSALPEQRIEIVAHSFGCLSIVATLAQYPEFNSKVKNLVLVAPANPIRFGIHGFADDAFGHYQDYFHQLKIKVPATFIMSENDPWLNFNDALDLASSWQLTPVNLGCVGHINVASGFGPFPEIFDFLISEKNMRYINISDDHKHLFKFAF